MRTLRILVVEDEMGPIKEVKKIAKLAAASLPTEPEVHVMRIVPLRGESNTEHVFEESWDYDVIVLDLEMSISAYHVPGEVKQKYVSSDGVYGGCLAADRIAKSKDFKGFVLANSAYITAWPDGMRDGRDELDRRKRLLYYRKGLNSPLASMLRQVLKAAAQEAEFSSELHQRILFAAGTDYPVLLLGETGTGKDLVARSIHDHWSLTKVTGSNGAGAKEKRPFVTINCALLTGEFLRDELMGHVKGAFTDASQHKIGAVLRAAGLSPKLLTQNNVSRGAANVGSEAFKKWLCALSGKQMEERKTASSPLDLKYNNEQWYGTIFLDELGHLDQTTQGMILRLLGNYEVSPLGYEGSITLGHLRVIAATSSRQWLRFADARNTPADQLSFEEGPKADLYHRLAYHVIVLAGLQESEVESFIKRRGKTKSFWKSEKGAEVIAGMKKEVSKFLGHRRELEKLIDLIEAYLEALSRLGRDDKPNSYDNVSWGFVKSNLWYPQRRTKLYDRKESDTSSKKAEDDSQKEVADDENRKIAGEIQQRIKDELTKYLGEVDLSKGINKKSLENILRSVTDPTKKLKLQRAMLECVSLCLHGRSKEDQNNIVKIAVRGVKDYKALYDFVRRITRQTQAPKDRINNLTSSAPE